LATGNAEHDIATTPPHMATQCVLPRKPMSQAEASKPELIARVP
jgi:hypothetical protein